MTSRRRFTVADGMVLVAASAVGLGLLHAHLVNYNQYIYYKYKYGYEYPDWARRLPDRHRVAEASLFLATWSLAVLLLQLRKPRLPLRRLVHRPGFAACLAATVGVALWPVIHVRRIVSLVFLGDHAAPYMALSFAEGLSSPIGTAIGATWLSLAIGGRWRLREPDWRGRLGRLLGWAWLILFVLLDFGHGLIRD